MKVDFNQIKTTARFPAGAGMENRGRLFQLLSQNEQRNAYHRHQAELAEPIYLLGRA